MTGFPQTGSPHEELVAFLRSGAVRRNQKRTSTKLDGKMEKRVREREWDGKDKKSHYNQLIHNKSMRAFTPHYKIHK